MNENMWYDYQLGNYIANDKDGNNYKPLNRIFGKTPHRKSNQ